MRFGGVEFNALFKGLLVALSALFGIFLSNPAAASTISSDEITSWNARATSAMEALEQDAGEDLTARISRLEEVRAELATLRDTALARSRIESLEANIIRGQIGLLGPVPESGETDFETAQRNTLAEALYDAREPNRLYQESYLRLAAVIADYDARIGRLEQERLTTRARSPLSPAAWIAFFRESPGKLQAMFLGPEVAAAEIANASALLISGIAIALLAIGLLFMGYIRHKILKRVNARMVAAGNEVPVWQAILGDLAGLGFSLLGMGFLIGGTMLLVGVFPGLGRVPLLILSVGLTIVIAQWISMVIFAPAVPGIRLVALTDKGAQHASWMLIALGCAVGIETVLEAIEEDAPYTADAASILPSLLILLTSAALYGLARSLSLHREKPIAETEDAAVPTHEEDEFINRRIDWLGLSSIAMKGAAIGSVIIAAIGFVFLARAILLPTIETLLIVAIAVITYNRLRGVADLVANRFFDRRNGVGPVFRLSLGALLTLLAIPIVSLMWGVRAAQLGDFVGMLRDGFTVGGATISLETVAVFLGVFIAGYILTRWMQRLVQTSSIKELGINDGTRSALVTGIGYIGVIISFVIAVAAAGIDLSNLAIVLGALSVGIGFGMQSVVSNFISGIIMLVERPIKEGDLIEVGGNAGIVDKIAVRATRIQSFDHDDIIIPNSELITGVVRNRTLTDRMTRIECAVGIAYDSDIQTAFDIVRRLAAEHERVPDDPAPNVVMEQLGDSALALRLYCFVDDISVALSTKSQLYVQIVEEFRKAGIEIPYPQSDVWVKSLPQKGE